MFHHLAQRVSKPLLSQSLHSASRSTFSTSLSTRHTQIPTTKLFGTTRSQNTKRHFSTTTTPTTPAPETAQSQSIPKSVTEPTLETEAASPTWKNPIVFTLDAIVAGTVAYGAIQAYDFVFRQPRIIDVMFEQAQQSPFLIENLGVPMKRDMLWWGSVDDHQARVNFGISGPNGSGNIEGKAFRVTDDHWELIYLYGALPEFENRLTDLLPVDEEFTNTMPYIPDPNDPSAAHALTGAPALPFTPAKTEGHEEVEPVLLPNPAYNQHYTPFEKGADHQQWYPEKVSENDEDDDGFRLRHKRDLKQEAEIGSEITRQHLMELEAAKASAEEVAV